MRRRARLAGLILPLVLLPALPGLAQDRGQTLADIRAEIGALGAELTALRAELVTTGAIARPGGGDMLARMETLELELMRLTGRTEDLEFRVQRIVSDGTNRLADLEFRLVELEGGDVSALGETPALGGNGPSAPAAPAGPQLAESERAEYDRARGVLGQGDFRTALAILEAHAQAWPDSPLSGEVHFMRGEALEGLGETGAAARAYLESFSGYPEGMRAPDALLRLGLALERLDQRPEACVTLAEVGVRYPGSAAAADAVTAMETMGCS